MGHQRATTNSKINPRFRPYSFITCVYVATSILLLVYFDKLNDIGRYEMSPYIIFLGVMEIAKYLHSANKTDKTRIKSQNIAFGAFLFLASVIIYFSGTILMGAEISGQFEGTVMFSFLLSVLTVLPVNLYLGSNYVTQIIFRKRYDDVPAAAYIIQNTFSVIAGAWFGSFAIPLDWDRPWQVWPITCSTGALGGFFLSNLLISVGFPNYFQRKSATSKYGL